MALSRKRFHLLLLSLLVVAFAIAQVAQAQDSTPRRNPDLSFPNVLYGAAYYNEYMPGDDAAKAARLEKDIALMKAADISVVRMGESTWSLWEPEDGHFEYAWMDRIVDAMGKAGIKVILGTPTYSIPAWMAHQHPEILADRIPPGPFGGPAQPVAYGIRQNMDTDSPAYRFYAERLIRHIVAHYKDNPTVIGWQLDNETSSYGAANPDVFIGFQHYLEKKFKTPEALSQAWFLNYWGENIHTWEDLPKRDGTISTGYKLEWTRWSQMRVTDFLHWQAELVRECAGPRQFITTDYGGMLKRDVNEEDIAKSLDIVANNIYHATQDNYDGSYQSLQSDFARSLKHSNFLVTETNAQTIGWSSESQFPPYDGQLREDVYTYLADGANMVEYWHWASIAANQETYWKGILSHDLEPNREYAEMSKTAHELKKIGPHLVGLKIHNDVAILYSRDSANAISFMPYGGDAPSRSWTGEPDGYLSVLQQMHKALYDLNIGSDFVFPETTDFSQYKLLIVPVLYISDDALLQRISNYVKNGGHVLMTFKSGFANENSAVRWVRAPGPLREATGFSYQEFSNLEKPLSLKGDPFHVGAEGNKVKYWAEFLMPEHAQAVAYYDHPFFGKWPAITENHYGSGTLTYEGTFLSDPLQLAIMKRAITEAGLASGDQQLPSKVHISHGVNRMGKKVHYYFNYSSDPQIVSYDYAAGTNLLDDKSVTHGQKLTLAPWDLAIIEE
ncbi:MAG: beta-galactosidase [Acidobacteriota bacterium]|nr:beta-galactosidase [Acidobacteriota bacterium]